MNFTLEQVIQFWFDSLSTAKASPTLRKHLNSALRLYLLERLGYKTREMSLSEFSHCLTTITLESFAKSLEKAGRSQQQTDPDTSVSRVSDSLDLAEVAIGLFQEQFQQAVEAQQTKRSTGNNYRSALKRFLQWLSTQPYWQTLSQGSIAQIAPRRLGNRKPTPSGKKRLEPYRLEEGHLPPLLRQELEQFLNFHQDGGDALWRQILWERRKAGQPVGRRPQFNRITAENGLTNEKIFILLFFGWQVHIQQTPIERIQLDSLTDALLIEEYTHWLISQRNRSHAMGLQLFAIGIALLKWRNFSTTQRRNWSDINEIEELRDYSREFREQYKLEKKRNAKTKWKERNLTHEQLQQICVYLRSRCAPYSRRSDSKPGKSNWKSKRTTAAICWDWQVYLMVSLLTYTAVRQQEPRQYKAQETLIRTTTASGEAVYVAQGIHDKNATRRGCTREYQLPTILTPDLDLWVQEYRPLAIQAVQSLDDWLRFWGHKSNNLKRLKQRLEEAQQGVVPSRIQDIQAYQKNLQKQIRGLESRIAAWQVAKTNITENDLLFFCFGSSCPSSFGKPFSIGTLYSMVQGAVAEASLSLFGYECRLNPHSFRHIAALHVRLNQGNKMTLALLMGHDEAMGDEYAAQAQDDISITAMADNWWVNPKTLKFLD